MGACLAGERFQIDMPYIHVKESYVNQEDFCHYYEIEQGDDLREIYQEQKKDILTGHHIYNLRDQQVNEESDHCKVSKNAQRAYKSLYKSRAKLKEKTYVQNVETGRQHTFVENNQSEMVDRGCPEGAFTMFGYIAIPHSLPRPVRTSREPNIENTKKAHHFPEKAECEGETYKRTRLKLQKRINKAQHQCLHEIPVYIKPSESSGIELCSMQRTQPDRVLNFGLSKLLTPDNVSKYVYAPTSNDMFKWKDWNNGFVTEQSPQNVLNDYIDASSQHEKKVYQQIQLHEGSEDYFFLENGDAIKLEKDLIHFRGFLLYLKIKQNERMTDLQIQNKATCMYCGRLVHLL